MGNNTMNLQKQADAKAPFGQPLSKTKQSYSAPCLVCHGDIRGITLGGSPGVGDSGTSTTEKGFS